MTDTDTEVDQEYRRYVAEIDLYEKEFRPWVDRGKKIIKLYKDSSNESGTSKKKRFNVLWSNVETLKPALYAREPQPVAERRFKDADKVGRAASEVIERCLAYTIDCQNYGVVTRQVVSDRLLPGRGIAWHRYEAKGADDSEDYTECVIPEYVYWEDFGHAFARTWEEVPMVWRRVYMTRARLVKRFKDVGQSIPLDYTPKGLKDEKVGEDIKKAAIYEIWDRDAGKVVFLSRAYPKVIESNDDPLHLTGMFPCQRPLFATLTTDSLVPVPDYALYQTQAQELEELTARIDSLQKALQLRGAYDASQAELANILSGTGNKLIPVNNWANFSEKGGIDGSIAFVPIKEVAETLIALYEAREKSKADLYEITGIADIIRGNSEPEETATAQQIKGRFAVLRISDSQQAVQIWVRDGMRIMGEIIAEHFALETIQAISGVKLPTQVQKQAFQAQQQEAQQIAQQSGQQPPPVDSETEELMSQPTWEEVYGLMQSQVLREFRIDIETDSTIRTDEDADRVARTEFLTAAGTYIQKVVEATQLSPELAPLAAELLMFGVRSFRSARSLEPTFEDAMKKIQAPKPDKPDPELQQIQAQAQADAQLEQIRGQTTMQVEEMKQRAQSQDTALTQQLEDQRSQRDGERELVLGREKLQNDMAIAQFEAQVKAQTDLQTAQLANQQAENDRQYEASQKDADRQSNERTTLATLDSNERTKKADLQSRAADRESNDKNSAADRDITEKTLRAKQSEKTDDDARFAAREKAGSAKRSEVGSLIKDGHAFLDRAEKFRATH